MKMMMLQMKNNIKQVWNKLEANAGKQVVKEQLSVLPSLISFVGVIGISGARIFQLEIPKDITIHINYLRKFSGVEVQVLPKDETTNEFTIILLEKDLSDIFTLFIEDIIEHLESVVETKDALVVINQRINYWRLLFGKITGELLSSELQRGLYGELLFLRLLLIDGVNKRYALGSWQGANSANQDFSYNGKAVEIKTSKAKNPSVFISNESQLDYSYFDSLYLGFITVDESFGQKNTLFQLIEEIKKILDKEPDLVEEFEIKLDQAGISRGTAENYNETTYTVKSFKFFEITDDFPVIIKSTYCSDAISNVKYQLNLASCKDFEVSEDVILKGFL